MPQNYELRIPNNGMNRDDESRLIEDTESRYILNLRSGSSESDNVGGLENIKGTTEVTFGLPDGENICIGSYGDQTTHSNFFFIFNSFGNHSIFRYIPESKDVRILIQDPILSFNEEDLINDIDVIDNLLYWNDGVNPQRKINIDKADSDDPEFRQCFNYYLGDTYLEEFTNPKLEIIIRDKRYSDITGSETQIGEITLNVDQSLLDDKKEIAKDLANQINATTTVNTPAIGFGTIQTPLEWEAEACGEFISIKITSSKFYSINSLDDNDEKTAQVIPQNHYQQYIERTIDVIKHPPHCNPEAIVKSDRSFQRNFIAKKVYQFAARYIYDDNEKTVVSPRSPNIYNPFICKQFTSDELNNYIEIDLSVYPELFKVEDLQTIKRIELFVKEGALGDWKSVTELEQYEFIDISNIKFDFYNNFIYDPVDQISFARPYHNVPILSKTQESVKNRIFYGNNLEQYDPVCVDANIDVTYNDVAATLKQVRHSVSGTIVIKSIFNGAANGAGYSRQPIWQKIEGDNPETVWGGMSDKGVKNLAVKSGQTLVLDGFVVYLAGTTYHAISRQRTGNVDGSMTQNGNNVYVGTGSGDMEDILKDNMEIPGMVQSDFNITDVPDGWYMLRVASHLTTQGQLDSGSLAYQDTSTNTYRIKNLSTGENQLRELPVHVQGGSIGNIEISIIDLSHDSNAGSSKIMSGYIVDHDIVNPISTYNEYLGDTRIPRARVEFNLNTDAEANNSVFGNALIATGGSIITDYNGFFFYASKTGGLGNNAMNIDKIFTNDVGGANGANLLGSLVSSGAGVNKTAAIEEDEYTIIANRAPKGNSEIARVRVIGNVVDGTGLGIPNTTIVTHRAQPVLTDSSGHYEFWHYGILKNTTTLKTYLFPVQTANICSARYTNQFYNFNFNYPSWIAGGPNSPDAINNVIPLIIDVPDFVGEIDSILTINAMKRGFDGEFGIQYTDRGIRSGAVNTSKELKLHIPFYTEKDSEGNINPGIPILNWEVKNTPPEWATHWQWVRTRNETVGPYFQWAVEKVEYTDASGNVTTFSAGTRVVLDIANLTDYKNLFPSLDFEVGFNQDDFRARFINDSKGNAYPEYFDYKILSIDGTKVFLEKEFETGEIKAGALFEFYSEKINIEEKVFYEFSECFEVGTDINGNKFHKGLSQNQDPLNPISTPAKGIFRTGDAYYRLRLMPLVGVNNPSFIDDDAVSDFYPSEVESIGRANGINPDFFQKWRPNHIRHGGKYVQDSNVNNISDFSSSDFQALPINYGDINKLQLASNVLLSIHEFRWVSNYIEESIIRKQGGGDELVASTKVFDSYRAAKPITGTINPESVREWRGKVYAIDINKGLVNKYDANGLTAISSFKMVDFFSDISKKILNNTSAAFRKPRILGFIDVKKDEYILSFNELKAIDTSNTPPIPRKYEFVTNSGIQNSGANGTLYDVFASVSNFDIIITFNRANMGPVTELQVCNRTNSLSNVIVKIQHLNGSIFTVTTLAPGQGIFNLDNTQGKYTVKTPEPSVKGKVLVPSQTLAYSEKFNKWTTFYSFKPEMFGDVNLQMLGFTNGRLWLHNDSEIRNNFYGIQYTSILETIFNNLPSQVKIFEATGVDSYYAWSVPSATTPNGMETEIVAERFVKREDSFHAPVMRDKNDPVIGDPQEAIVNGRQLRDRTIKVTFENEDTKEVVLLSVSMLSTISTRHGK